MTNENKSLKNHDALVDELLELKARENEIKKKRLSVESDIVEINQVSKIDRISVTRNKSMVWDQAELEDVAQTTDFPILDYFNLEYKPKPRVFGSVIPKELQGAYTIKENKPTIKIKE